MNGQYRPQHARAQKIYLASIIWHLVSGKWQNIIWHPSSNVGNQRVEEYCLEKVFLLQQIELVRIC